MSQITEEGQQLPDINVDLVRLSPHGEPLSPFLVLLFCSKGIFPWLRRNGRLMWWDPEPRSVLILSELNISRSMRKLLRSGKFRVTVDTVFDEVVHLCAETRDETWIDDEFRDVFHELHELGHAHSVEVWKEDQLVGGLFGLCVGELFCGYSMFHLEPNASKVALVKLAELLTSWNIPLLDCHMHNPHLKRMGARIISRDVFHKLVNALVRQKRRIGKWTEHVT